MSAKAKARTASRQQRDQMLKLVAKGFYNEMTKYGVQKDEIVRVTSHLLDNLMTSPRQPDTSISYYNALFTLASVQNDWSLNRQLSVQHVAIRPLPPEIIPQVAGWLALPAVRESFVPAFPKSATDLRRHFADPTREYFGVYYEEQPVGIVGGENIDREAGKLEMKKLVGETGLQGKGIGKRATFCFLYYAFMILNLNKVYIHSRDINMSNLNLNSRFGFELEGVFFEDVKAGDQRQDVVRMALFKSLWLQIFSHPPVRPRAA